MTSEVLEYIVHAQDRDIVLLKQRVDALNRSLAEGSAVAGRSANQNLSKVGKTAGRVGLVVAGGMGLIIAKSLGAAAAFQQSLNIFQAVSSSTTEQMASVRAEAIKLGADLTLPATSAKDAAEAMTELAKGGLDVKTVLAASHGTLMLSAAAGISNADAAKIQVRALKAFSLAGKDANRVADLLAGGANASTAEITDMADGFQMAASQSRLMGVPIEDLTTGLALMADRGIKGSMAGSAIKNMLVDLVPHTRAAIVAMGDLGIIQGKNNTLFDAHTHKFIGLAAASEKFRQAMKGMTLEQKVNALHTIFGTKANQAANIILLGGAKAWNHMKEAVTKQGQAAVNANARNKGLKGAMDGFKSTAETLAIVIGTTLLPAAEAFLRRFLIPAAAWLSKHKTLTVILGGVILALGVGLLVFSAAVKLYTFATAEATASTISWTTALLANPVFGIIVVLIALGVAMVVLYKKSETFRTIVQGALHGVVVAFGYLKDAFGWFRDHADTIWSVIKVALLPVFLYIRLAVFEVKLAFHLLQLGFEWFRDHAAQIWAVVKVALLPYILWFKLSFAAVKLAVEGIIDAFKWVAAHGGQIWKDVKDATKAALDKLTSAFGSLWDKLKPIIDSFHWLIGAADKIGGAIHKIGGVVGGVAGSITGGDFGGVFPPGAGGGAFPASISPHLYDEIAGGYGFGLGITSGYRPGARTKHGTASDHGTYPSHAVDMAGSATGMARFFTWLVGQSDVKQAFYDPLGSIFNGVWNPYREGGHSDHVHVATYDQGGYLPPGLTLALNKTGRPERVIGPDGGDRPIVNIYVAGSVTSERDLVRAVHEGLRAAGRRNNGTGL